MHLYIPYVRSKSTQVIKKNEGITLTTDKFKEVYANL